MKAFIYGIGLQFKLDIRNKSMLITCYVVPLIFFLFMGGIFTSIDPTAVKTLIPSMTVFVISMGALIGMPPSLSETYGTDVKKVYKANGVPLCLGAVTQLISSFLHLMIVSLIIFFTAPLIFKAELPANVPLHFGSAVLLALVTLSIGCIFGLTVKEQAKLTMFGMIIFLPSIMLSGIMFPASMLPQFMQYIAYAFPAATAFMLTTDFALWQLLTLLGQLLVFSVIIIFIFRRMAKS